MNHSFSRIILLVYLLVPLHFINTVFGQHTDIKPMIHLSMDRMPPTMHVEDQINCDSLIQGILGKAFCFYEGSTASYGHIMSNNILPSTYSGDFSVSLWVNTKSQHLNYELIAANKQWNNGYIKDYTTNAAYGISRTSGINQGWAIICQPDGSWAWNISDGQHRIDYRPTAPRQMINDGMWHQIAFSISRSTDEAYLYFDGINVAIYNIKGMKSFGQSELISFATDILTEKDAPRFYGAIDEFRLYDYFISPDQVAKEYSKLVPATKLPELSDIPLESLNLMAWNIWHGGRRHGQDIGPKQVIDFIKNTNTDIVMMQETYGSGPRIADALGYYFYLASTNISVLSKYPIVSTKAPYDAFRLGMTTIELSKGQKINLASLWIHYLPDWRNDVRAVGATSESIVKGEARTRHKEIKEVLHIVESEMTQADDVPFIIGGDFNSPSMLDWTNETKSWHSNLNISWPVSEEMIKAGFKDSFRESNPNLQYSSPTMTAEKISYRIDYIYYMGQALQTVESNMHFEFKGAWPSDHPAVTTRLRLTND